LVVDIDEQVFKDTSSFDYSKLVDGGAQFRDIERMGNVYSRIPSLKYMAAK
jgi:hypothetical protein